MMSYSNIREFIENWILVDTEQVSYAQAVGAQAATARSNCLGNINADPRATGIQIYTEPQNLPTAVASLLNKTQNKANFHPAAATPDELVKTFSEYAKQVDINPFFHLIEHDHESQSFSSSEYNLMIDQIVKLYKGLSVSDLDEMKTSISDMAKSVFIQQHSDKWKNLFAQSTIDFSNPDEPRFYLYYTSLHMSHQKSGKSDVSEQSYDVTRTSYKVLPDLIAAYAKTLATQETCTVDDWMKDGTSRERPDAKLCFRPTSFSY